MNAPRFDGFARTIATRLSRRRSLGLLAGASLPFAGLAEAALAGKKKGKKVTLCLNGQTVTVSKKKSRKRLKQGATKGACQLCPIGQERCRGTCIPSENCCVDSDCPTGGVCTDGLCLITIACGNGGACSVFVTSAFFTGSEVGGVAGADAKCQSLADSAGLPGTFRAWLSESLASTEPRFSRFTGPWELPPNVADGENFPPLVATDFADLTTCGPSCLSSPINRTETGNILEDSVSVWTNTLADGTASTDSCSGWTSDTGFGLFGDTSQVDARWTDANATFGCNSALALYCFEQGV
jgi:hypothetical protein